MREKILRIKTQDIYRFVQAALLVCIVLFGAGGFVGVSELKGIHFLIALTVLATAQGLHRMTKKGRIVSLLSLLIILLITGMTLGIRNCFAFFRSYGSWLIGTDMWEAAWAVGYEMLQIVFATLFCYILQCILEKNLFFKMAAMCMCFCTLLFCLLTEKQVSHAGVVFILTYIVLAGGEWTEHFWDKERRTDKKAYMLWIMPFMAIYVLAMLWMPAPEKPFSWQFARNAFSQVQESFIAMTQNIIHGDKENFDTSLSGFPEDGELNGNLEDEHRAVMVIQGDDDLVTNVYLAGRVYDTFDGRQWYQEDTNAAYDTFLDTMQTRYAAELYEGKYLHDCLSLTTLHIGYRYFNTAYVFVPLKTESLMEGNERLSFISEGGNLLFADKHQQKADKRGYGTEYDVAYYQLNTGSWDFEDFLIFAQEENVSPEPDDILKFYAQDVQLSDEVRAYVDEITRYAYNDVEKLQMIEAELSSYTYTKSPGKLPDTVEDAASFLDYFLLESREGYCTYFATAFTLLARAEGIPTRYVQGFCVPIENGEETLVYGDMGHSWPEVYIRGVGWIPFEPTPGYANLRYTPWKTGQESENTLISDRNYGNYVQGDLGQAAEESELLNDSEMTMTVSEEAAAWRDGVVGKTLKIAVFATWALAALGFLFVTSERIIRKRRYQKMDLARKFHTAVQDNLRILSWLGLRRKDTETLQEFGKRATLELGLKKEQLAFIEKYEALLYGEKCADETAVKEAGYEREQLLVLLKAKKKRTYLYYRAFMSSFTKS